MGVSWLLSDLQIKRAKAKEKPYKLADSEGLHLYISTAGAKLWRLKYRYADKEKLLSIGPYPDVSLVEARDKRRQAKEQLREGKDPGIVKRQAAAASAADSVTTFEVVAREWHDLNKSEWTDVHANDVLRSLEVHIFPVLGPLPINSISPPMILKELRRIEARPAIETAHRVRQRVSAVFVHAIASGVGKDDPAAVVKSALKPIPKGKQPAITDLGKARAMLRATEAADAHPVTKLATRLIAITALRPGALRAAPWREFDGVEKSDSPVWIVPAVRMKLRKHLKADETRSFIVPLPRQAVDVIRALRTLTDRSPFVFPNARSLQRPMSANTMGYLLNRVGYHGRHVAHGWRATFSTVMNELRPADRQVIDLMLAHMPKDAVEGAYNRAAYMPLRREIAQEWADLLLEGAPSPQDVVDGLRR